MDTTAIYMNYTKALEQAGSLSNVAKEVSSLASDDLENLMKNIKKDWTGTNSENYLGKMEALKKAIAQTATDIETVASTIKEIAQRDYEANMAAAALAESRTFLQ